MAEAGHGVAVGAMVGTSIFGYQVTRPISTISEGGFGSRARASTVREEGGLFDGQEVGALVCGFSVGLDCAGMDSVLAGKFAAHLEKGRVGCTLGRASRAVVGGEVFVSPTSEIRREGSSTGARRGAGGGQVANCLVSWSDAVKKARRSGVKI